MFENILFAKNTLPKPLPDEEIRKLFIEMKNGNKSSREKIIMHNIRLVFHKVHRLKTTTYDMEELVLVGTFGLIKCIDTFDLSKNIMFSTYAGRCITNEILMYYRKERKHSRVDSFDKVIVDGKKKITVASTILDDYDLVEDFEHRELLRKLSYLVENLRDREKEIIKLYFGFYGKEYEQKEIAEMLSISQSYVSRIIRETLTKLKFRLKVENLVKTK